MEHALICGACLVIGAGFGCLLSLLAVGAGQYIRYRRQADARRPQAESPVDLERRLRHALRTSDGVPTEVRDAH